MRAIYDHSALGCLCLAFFLYANGIEAQAVSRDNKLKVFVWDFTTSKLKKNELTGYLTEDFEEKLIQTKRFRVLERRKYAWLLKMVKTEKSVLSIEGIPKPALDSLEFLQADAVIFGEVRDDFEAKQRKITVKLQGFDGEVVDKQSISAEPTALYDARRREEAMKELAERICKTIPPPPLPIKEWGRAFSKISHSAAALVFIASANHFGDKANKARRSIPPVLSEERVRVFGEYNKFQTREHCYYLTAANLVVTSLPFWFDLKNIKPRIGKWPLASFLFVGSTTFFTYAVISGEKADDTYDKLKAEYLRLSEDRVTYWGKYQKYLERERVLYINAAIDLVTAIEILLWYTRDDENRKRLHIYIDSQKSTKLSLDVGNGNWIYAPQISIVLQKSF
jgi:hypothetical protein